MIQDLKDVPFYNFSAPKMDLTKAFEKFETKDIVIDRFENENGL